MPFVYNERKSVKTKNDYTFLVPNWHPFKAIIHFASFGVSDTGNLGDSNDTTDCLFFQNKEADDNETTQLRKAYGK